MMSDLNLRSPVIPKETRREKYARVQKEREDTYHRLCNHMDSISSIYNNPQSRVFVKNVINKFIDNPHDIFLNMLKDSQRLTKIPGVMQASDTGVSSAPPASGSGSANFYRPAPLAAWKIHKHHFNTGAVVGQGPIYKSHAGKQNDAKKMQYYDYLRYLHNAATELGNEENKLGEQCDPGHTLVLKPYKLKAFKQLLDLSKVRRHQSDTMLDQDTDGGGEAGSHKKKKRRRHSADHSVTISEPTTGGQAYTDGNTSQSAQYFTDDNSSSYYLYTDTETDTLSDFGSMRIK